MALVMVKESPRQFNRILPPLDGSDLAEMALAPAPALEEVLFAEIVLLRVVDPLSIKPDPGLYQRIIKGGQNQAKVFPHSIEVRSPFSQIRLKGETIVRKAAGSINNYVQENEIDMIAMTSYGCSGILL